MLSNCVFPQSKPGCQHHVMALKVRPDDNVLISYDMQSNN